MLVQLTTYGVSVLQANGAVNLDFFKLGSDSAYTPDFSDVDIHGSQVYHGTPSLPLVVNPNVVRYSIQLGYELGPFEFGEIGLYYNNQLFALAVANEPLHKLVQTATALGSNLRIDIYISIIGSVYEMWLDVAGSGDSFRLPTLTSPDLLPAGSDSVPNAFIIQGQASDQSAMLAYADKNGLWQFDAYQFATAEYATILSADALSVTVDETNWPTDLVPDYLGQLILEFTTGAVYSICRYVKTSVTSGGTVTLGFNTPLLEVPAVGDKFVIFRRTEATTQVPVLDIASPSVLGGVKIGSGLSISGSGVLSVDPLTIGYVTSVNGQQNAVVINATNLPGLAAVAKSGLYADLSGTPAAYSLPVMGVGTRGGARLPVSGNLIITTSDILDLGFAPVKKVNNVAPDGAGNVNLDYAGIVGLVNPKVLLTGDNLNNYKTPGLFYATAALILVNAPAAESASLEVIPMASTKVVQRWTGVTIFWRAFDGSSWSAWTEAASNIVATPITPGVIMVGPGLTVDGTGLVSVYQVPASTTALGFMQVGDGLEVDVDGLVSTVLLTVNGISPDGAGNITISTSGVGFATTLDSGVIQVGSGLSVTVGGILSVATTALAPATTTALGVVSVGTGLSIDGAGVLTADVPTLPLATTSSTGVISVGAGLLVDGAGELTVDSSAITFPDATTLVKGVVRVGSGLAVSSGVISLDTTALPVATAIAKGVMQVGSGLSVASGVVSVDNSSLNVATTTTLGVVKVGTGLSVSGAGLVTVDTAALPVATTGVKGLMQVGTGLSVASGVVSTVADANKLDATNGVATGFFLTFLDDGTTSGATTTVSVASANVQHVAFSGSGTVTWTISGWPAATYAELQLELTDAGLRDHVFPTINWVNPDGTQTTSFVTYIGNKRSGATNFQASGTDFVCLWSRDGGTTTYGAVL